MSRPDYTIKRLLARQVSHIPKGEASTPLDAKYDQFYTLPEIAALCYRVIANLYELTKYLLIEPSAGEGAFLRLFEDVGIGIDIDSKYPGVIRANYLELEITSSRKIMVIGNPPFGCQAAMAIAFFQQAAMTADVIAMILPLSIRKARKVNRLNPYFRLRCEWVLPANSFTFRGMPRNVAAVFQVWERHTEQRALLPVETSHPGFEFTTPDKATFVIPRNGGRAGTVLLDFDRNERDKNYYYIRGDVNLFPPHKLVAAATNVAAARSLSKSEIVAIFKEELAASRKPRRRRMRPGRVRWQLVASRQRRAAKRA